jgi:hypothetical protein
MLLLFKVPGGTVKYFARDNVTQIKEGLMALTQNVSNDTVLYHTCLVA